MTTQTKTQEQQIWEDMLSGRLSFEAGRQLLTEFRGKAAADAIVVEAQRMRKEGLASGATWAQPNYGQTTQPLLPQTETQRIENIGLEERTDPQTAYLSRLGIGGKQFYNPAERYAADLFDPYKDIYDIRQRLHGPSGPLQDPSRQEGSFADFYDKFGGGIGGVTQGARQQLQSIFGAKTPVQTTLGYEPGQYLAGSEGELGGQLNPGRLGELQKLLEYGLRPTAGTLGARYAAQRLPQAQQAYYSQRAAGQPGASGMPFVEWLKSVWGLNP